jgi:FkbM family methyltransferase
MMASMAAGRNPLFPMTAMISLAQEYRSIRNFLHARNQPVRPIKEHADTTLWETALGPLVVPQGATAHFVKQVSMEILGGVYPLDWLPKGGTVLDAGANIGCFSRYAFQNGAGRVIAFEPAPLTARCLRENVPQSEVINAGVWHEETTLSFTTAVASNPGANHICAPGEGNITVPVVTIDQTVETLKCSRVDYIKMDIEGAEVNALRGASETIRRFKPELAIATEHTEDLIANATAVIETIQRIHPAYKYVVTESHFTPDANGHFKLIPYTLHFRCPRT